MIRSRSSSNIPIPTALQNKRDSRNKERTKSTARCSSRESSFESHTPLAFQRPFAGGPDRKYSIQKNQLRTPTTPMFYGRLVRSNSQTSFGSRVSSARCKSPGDKKNLHKLLKDKKWLAEQQSKVQDFLLTSGLFDPELAGKIRPPTIAIFIEIISVLFGKIMKTGVINSQNYTDEVMKTLKILRYPGPITASTLKTVNVLNIGYPHFISIVSWLIDRVNLVGFHSAFMEQQEEDEIVVFRKYQALFSFLNTQYKILTSGESPDNSYDELYQDMLKITGIDNEVASKTNKLLEQERNEVHDIKCKLQDIEEDNAKLKNKNMEMEKVICQYKNSKGNEEKELGEEIEQLKKILYKHTENKSALVISINELEGCISKQSCKLKEKNEILCQIEDLKRVIERKKRKLAEYRAVRDDLDHELQNLVIKIESEVDAWNISITKTFLPELENLRLREKGFHSAGFLEEITKIHKEMIDWQEKLLREFKTSQYDMEELQKRKITLVESNKMLDFTKERIEDLKESIKLLDERNREVLIDLDKCNKNHELKMKRLEETEKLRIKEKENIIADLALRKQHLTNEIDETAQKGLAVIVETHNQTIKNIQKINEVMVSMVNDAKASLSDAKNNLEYSFNHLLSLQKTTSKLYKEFNQENIQ